MFVKVTFKEVLGISDELMAVHACTEVIRLL